MRHVRSDKMTGAEGAVETEFTGKDTRSDDAGKLTRIVARRGWMSTTNAEEIQHGGLRFEDGTAANGTDLNGRHRDGDLQVAVYAVIHVSLSSIAI